MTFSLPEAAAIRMVFSPCLSVNRLIELRDLIDRLMLSSSGGVCGGPSNDALGTGKVGLVHDPAIGRTAATESKDGTRVAEEAQIEGNVRRDYHGTGVTGKEMRMALRQRMATRAERLRA